MSNALDRCVPCIECGSKPEVISNFWGRDHDDLRCPCGRRTDVDGKVKWAIKAWNDMNITGVKP